MPVMKGDEIEFFSHGPSQTRRFGAHLGALVQPGDVVLLHGTLGAGKTHFAQGIAQGLGIEDPVRSPTFTLINEYHDGRIPLYHIDLYRLEGEGDLASIGLDEYLDVADGVIVVEWPEKGGDWLPATALLVYLQPVGDLRRTIRMDAHAPGAQALLRAYRAAAFAS